jgi:hypothetical protein
MEREFQQVAAFLHTSRPRSESHMAATTTVPGQFGRPGRLMDFFDDTVRAHAN